MTIKQQVERAIQSIVDEKWEDYINLKEADTEIADIVEAIEDLAFELEEAAKDKYFLKYLEGGQKNESKNN